MPEPSLFESELCQLTLSRLENAENIEMDSRLLLYRLNQNDIDQNCQVATFQWLNRLINQASAALNPDLFKQSIHSLTNQQTKPVYPFEDQLNEQQIRFCLQQIAPVLLKQPSWLNKISQAFSIDNEFCLSLNQLLWQLHPSEQAFQHALVTSMFQFRLQPAKLFQMIECQNPELTEESIAFSCLQSALTQFPRLCFYQILGFSLAYSTQPHLIRSCMPDQILQKHSLESVAPNLEPYRKLITKTILNNPACQQKNNTAKIKAGFLLYVYMQDRLMAAIKTHNQQPSTLEEQIIALIQQKSEAALGHHHNIQIQGKSLDSWLLEAKSEPAFFLQILADSDYIDRLNPLKSRLLKQFEFEGSMFGVLNPQELTILKKWLSSLAEKTPTQEKFPPLLGSARKKTWPDKPTFPSKRPRLSNRAWYFHLVNIDCFPEYIHAARHKVQQQLKHCALFNRPPFKDYNHARFESHIKTIYQTEMAAYRPLTGRPSISKAAYIWGFEQIAPMILLDGCWLQHYDCLAQNQPEIYQLLAEIYADETGRGHLKQNHAHIFRQLLNSLDIQLPAAHEKAFIQQSQLMDSAFDLPVFMLALSLSSDYFLPELLGLNMAIELSGLGNKYMRLVDELDYWGIDSSIAKIHISIDNYASGHTFLAQQAIIRYLDEIKNHTSNQQQVNQSWLRIANGYASLRWIGKRFQLQLPVYYLKHKYLNSN